MKQTVWVVAFDPRDAETHGVGGFDWGFTPEVALKLLEKHLIEDKEFAACYDYRVFPHETEEMDAIAITNEIETTRI